MDISKHLNKRAERRLLKNPGKVLPHSGISQQVDCKRMKCLLGAGEAGVQAWNAWRIENGEEQLTIEIFDLDGLELNKVNFNNCILSYGTIKDAELNEATFNASDIRGIDFNRSFLRKAEFEAALLKNVIFKKASLEYANFEHAALDGRGTTIPFFQNTAMSNVNMRSVSIYDIKFEHCMLKESSFVCATVDGSYGKLSFKNSNLWNSDLSELRGNMHVYDSDMSNVRLDASKLRTVGAYPSTFRNVNLIDISCKNVDWQDVLVEYSNVFHADFSGAHLQNTHFIGNNRLAQIKFNDTRLQSCKIEGNQKCNFKSEFIKQSSTPEGVYVTDKGVYRGRREEQGNVLSEVDPALSIDNINF